MISRQHIVRGSVRQLFAGRQNDAVKNACPRQYAAGKSVMSFPCGLPGRQDENWSHRRRGVCLCVFGVHYRICAGSNPCAVSCAENWFDARRVDRSADDARVQLGDHEMDRTSPCSSSDPGGYGGPGAAGVWALATLRVRPRDFRLRSDAARDSRKLWRHGRRDWSRGAGCLRFDSSFAACAPPIAIC